MRRVSGIRFSKCSDFSYGILTQSLEPTKTATGSFCWTHWRIRHPWLKSHSRQHRVAELLVMNRTLRKSNTLHKSHFFTYPCAISLIYISLPTCVSCGECVILSARFVLQASIHHSLLRSDGAMRGLCIGMFVDLYFYLLAYLFVGVLVHLYICGFEIVFVRLGCYINLSIVLILRKD